MKNTQLNCYEINTTMYLFNTAGQEILWQYLNDLQPISCVSTPAPHFGKPTKCIFSVPTDKNNLTVPLPPKYIELKQIVTAEKLCNMRTEMLEIEFNKTLRCNAHFQPIL